MRVPQVGDKITVLVDRPAGANEMHGTILTVVRPMGFDQDYPDCFGTNATTEEFAGAIWVFSMANIKAGEIAILHTDRPRYAKWELG